ncbi:MAG: hypothetical protein Q9217_004992 [Psora testacea]
MPLKKPRDPHPQNCSNIMAPVAAIPNNTATADDDATLPFIPLAPLLESSSATTQIADSLLSAFRSSGFLYLTDFSALIPPELVEAVFTRSAHFFARPPEEKDALEWTTPRSNRGYASQGREKVSQGMSKDEVAKARESGGEDLKESFEIGRDDEEGHPNRWPLDGSEESADFRRTMKEFFLSCKEMHKVLMRGIAIAMRLEADFFDGFVRSGDNTLRLLHYPAIAAGGFEGGKRVRAGAHSDYGSVTLLFQDQRGGLQVERPGGSGRWLNVTPKEGTIVVNAGDLLARWSNDLIRSTKHQVVEPPSHEPDGGHPPRYSVAYFCNPDFDRYIEALPGTWDDEEGGKKYEGVNSGEYLVQRLTATY